MMVENHQPILLIDGNNLAHFLYTNLTSGQKMTVEMAEQLISHLNSYARQYSDRIIIECILDRMPGAAQNFLNPNLLFFAAEYPQNGDDLLLERFWYHHVSLHACLTVTNDDEILNQIKSAKGNFLRVYDFVRRAGIHNPVFRDPDDLPALLPPITVEPTTQQPLSLRTSIHFRIAEDQHHRTDPERPAIKPAGINNFSGPSLVIYNSVPPSSSRVELDHSETVAHDEESPISVTQNAPTQYSVSLPNGETVYVLNLETWPLNEGARFLRQSFCSKHREEYRDLLSSINYENIQPDDLRAVAELLLHACASEASFCMRGSLIDRVRLALLHARGQPLSLDKLAQKTGLPKPGLNRKVRLKAGRWVKIIPVFQ